MKQIALSSLSSRNDGMPPSFKADASDSRKGTPISAATIEIRVVLPVPPGPVSRKWSSGRSSARAAATATRSRSTAARWPMTSLSRGSRAVWIVVGVMRSSVHAWGMSSGKASASSNGMETVVVSVVQTVATHRGSSSRVL